MTATFFIFLSCTHEEATTRAFFQNSGQSVALPGRSRWPVEFDDSLRERRRFQSLLFQSAYGFSPERTRV
jgi:hypothetical protein